MSSFGCTYYIGDVKTQTVLDELPLSNVVMSWKLSGAGTLTADLAMAGSASRFSYISEGKHTVYVDFNGDLIYAGIIWQTEYDSDTSVLKLSCSDFWSYFAKTIVDANVSVVSYDLNDLLTPLINTYALNAYAPAQLIWSKWTTTPYPIANPDGTKPTYSYFAADRHTVAEIVEGLAASTPGVDFRMATAWLTPGQTAQITLLTGIPAIGSPISSTNAIFEAPGTIVKYIETRDATKMANRVWVNPRDNGDTTQIILAQDTTNLTTYPRYDGTDTTHSVKLTTATAAARLQYRKNPAKLLNVTVRADGIPYVSGYHVGDDIQLQLTDNHYPNTTVLNMRIAEIEFTPADGTALITPWSPDGTA